MNLHLFSERPVSVLLALVPALLNIYLIFYTWKKIPRNSLSDLFIYFVAATITWQLNDLFDRLSGNIETTLIFDKIFCHGWILIPSFGLRFAYKMVKKSSDRVSKATIFLIYLPAIVFMSLYSSFTTAADYKYLPYWGWFNMMNSGPVYLYIALWFALFASITLAFFINGLRLSKKGSPEYYKFLLLSIGFAIPGIQGIITEVLFPISGLDPIPVTTSVMVIFTLTAFIALKRYNLFRIEDSISATSLMNSLTDIVIAVNPENKIVYLNPNGAAFLGYSNSELNAKDISKLVVNAENDGCDIVNDIIKPAFSGKHLQQDNCIVVKKDGSRIPVSIVTDSIFNDKIPAGVLLIARDISELKKNLYEIKHQNQLTQQLFNASPLAMVLLTTDGVVLRVNDAFETMFQYTSAEVLHNKLEDFLTHHNYHEDVRTMWEEAARPPYLRFDSKRLRKNGDLFDVSINLYMIRGDKKVTGVYIIYEDITQRKEAEALLNSQNTELIKVNKELDKFIYSISHDIRAPLMSMKGIVAMAGIDAETTDDYKMYLDLIGKNVNRLDEFTISTIRYYKNAREEVSPEKTDFSKIVLEVLDSLRYQKEARDMEFIMNISQPRDFNTDINKLKIIFNNLISNAIKYRADREEKSWLKIEISVDSNVAVIMFEDNGEGIAEDMLDKIFIMFTRYSNRSNGSGLGLYIVKEMIGKLKGDIKVASVLGKGTKFMITLPEYSTGIVKTEG